MYAKLGIYVDRDPTDPEVQELIAGWHQHLRYFYEPSPEMLSGLGQLYAENPDFVETFTAIDPRLPEFLRDAITYYVAGL
ncbi:MAG: TipAS antibiotic-recognition domain-containing protein [Chloroflexota bacterium]